MSISEIIAETRLELQLPAGGERPVVVQIGKPRPDPEPGGVWVCPYEIHGLGDGDVFASEGCGEDSMQALLLALEGIHATLAHHPRSQGTITRHGESDLWLLPRAL